MAQLLADHDLKDVHYLQGGFDAWRDAGYPLEPKAKAYAAHRH